MIWMQHWKFLFAFFCSEKQLNLFEQFHGSLFCKRKRKIHIKILERACDTLNKLSETELILHLQSFDLEKKYLYKPLLYSVFDFAYMYTYKCHETRNYFPRNLIEYVLLLRTFTNCIYIGSRIPANKEPVDFQNCAKLCANCFCCKCVNAKGFCLLIRWLFGTTNKNIWLYDFFS